MSGTEVINTVYIIVALGVVLLMLVTFLLTQRHKIAIEKLKKAGDSSMNSTTSTADVVVDINPFFVPNDVEEQDNETEPPHTGKSAISSTSNAVFIKHMGFNKSPLTIVIANPNNV